MKRLIGLVLVVVIALPLSVFAASEAKISWGAWGRAVFAPAVSNANGEVVPREVASWGWDSRIGFTIRGESERVGFQADMKADANKINTNDQQKIWIKPTDTLTVEFGPNVFWDTLRGNAAFGSWDWIRFNGIGGEDTIFARGRAGENAAGGAIVHYDQNGMHAFGVLNVVESADREDFTTALMLQRGQYGFGYELKGLGLARIQYIGKAYDKDPSSDELESYAVINGAVRIDQAIANLYLDAGVFVPTDTDNTNGDRTKIAAYVKYTLSPKITSHLLAEAELDKPNAEGKEGTGIKCGVGADVDLGNGLALNTDVRFHNENAVATADVDSQVAFLVGIKKGFSNGVIGIGFEGTTHQFTGGVVDKENADDFAWAIPIRLEYWF